MFMVSEIAGIYDSECNNNADLMVSAIIKSSFDGTVEPLLYDHPQNHIGVVV